MQVIYERCAAVDVGKDVIAVAVRKPGDGPGGRVTVRRTYKTFYGVLREAARWLMAEGVTHVAMEATGIYSMPVYHALIEHGDFEKVLVCNAGHVKNVPGRKTDMADAEWLAQLLECGLLAGSFIPPAEVKAARDVIRYRAKIAQQRVSEISRLGNVLQDAGIKLDSVAWSVSTKSGRLMIEALIDGERRGAVLGPGHREDAVKDRGPVDGAGGPVREPPRHAVPAAPRPPGPPRRHAGEAGRADRGDDAAVSRRPRPADHHPRDRAAVRRRRHLRDRHGRPRVLPRRGAPGFLGRTLPRQPRVSREAPPRETQERQPAPPARPGRVRLGRGPARGLPQVPLPPARHEMGRLPLQRREDQGHHRRRPRHPRDHLARPGHR